MIEHEATSLLSLVTPKPITSELAMQHKTIKQKPIQTKQTKQNQTYQSVSKHTIKPKHAQSKTK